MPDETKASIPLAPWRDVRSLAAALNAGSPVATWTIPAIRALLAERGRNGLATFCRKVGARVLISEPGFNAWLAEQGMDDTIFSDDGEQPPEEGPDAPRRERRPFPKGGR